MYLSFDDVALRAIAAACGWSEETAAESLRQALKPYMDTARPFDHWLSVAKSWMKKGGASPPPFIHLLALTVLPATQRRGKDTLNGYYAPLFENLGITDSPARREDYRWSVPALWVILGKWLNEQQENVGLPTARPGAHATEYLGYSVSQAIVRGADRAVFIEFFEQVGYLPGDKVGAGLLTARFELWARRAQVTGRVRSALADHEGRAALGEVLRHDLETWTGESRDEEFRTVLRVVPRLNAARRTLTAVLRCPKQFKGLFAGDEVIASPGGDRVFLHHPIALDPKVRREYLEVDGARLQVRHGPVHAFEEDPILGGYTGVDRMTGGRSAWVAVAASAIAELQFLRSQGRPFEEWSRIPGWTIFRDVRLKAEDHAIVPPGLQPILPPSGLRTELRGGLSLGGRRYLLGGPPELVVPANPLALEVVVNDVKLQTIPAGSEAVVTMLEVAHLGGSYAVGVGDQTLRFELVEAGPGQDAAKTLWNVLLESPPTLLDLCPSASGDEVTVSGGFIEGGSAKRGIDLRSCPPATDGWMVLGPDGQVSCLPAAPTWLEQIGQSPCHMSNEDLTQTVAHPVEWIARVMSRRVHLTTPGGEPSPETDVPNVNVFGDRVVRVAAPLAERWVGFVNSWQREPAPFGSSQAAHRNRSERTGSAQSNIFERMLSWCSERGSGSVASFVETFQWMDHAWSERTRAHRALRALCRLGHVEVDWHKSRWAITPTVLVAPFNAGGLAFIMGSQGLDLDVRMSRAMSDFDLDIVRTDACQLIDGPRLSLVRSGSRQALAHLADAAGIEFEVDVGGALSHLLPTIDRMVRRGSILAGFERRRISVDGYEVKTTPVLDERWDGSYEHDTFGAMVYSIREEGEEERPYLVDRSTAIWYALRREARFPIRYDDRAWTLAVPTQFGLPLLHERSLILSTGLLPAIVRLDGKTHYIYSNIAPNHARRLEASLSR
ncbi:MAG: hypothetical protein QOE09_3370 [Ilumatobacteraceae bacterium]